MQDQTRILESRVSAANREHYCDFCEGHGGGRIFPGDLYERSAGVTTAGATRHFWVKKQHIMPPCEPDPRDFDEKFDSWSGHIVPIQLAA